MIFYMLLSIIIYFVCLPVFLFSSFCLIIISFLHFPFFFKADKIFCRLIMLSFFVCPRIVGSFPTKGTFIIMMNHSSFLDVFLFPLVPKGAYSGVTAIENFKYPVFSYLIRRLKAIPIDRKNTRLAIQSIDKAEKVLNDGIHIGILPEGSRTTTGKMKPLKKGGFHMAINTKTSIIPVGISGAFNFKPKNRWWFKPGPVTINIGDPIHHEEYTRLGIIGLSGRVEEKLKYLSGEHHEDR